MCGKSLPRHHVSEKGSALSSLMPLNLFPEAPVSIIIKIADGSSSNPGHLLTLHPAYWVRAECACRRFRVNTGLLDIPQSSFSAVRTSAYSTSLATY